MTRGDIVTIADRAGDFTGKPRPAVIVQADAFATMQSVTICPLTSEAVDDSILRIAVYPSVETALNRLSWIAVDKIPPSGGTGLDPASGHWGKRTGSA